MDNLKAKSTTEILEFGKKEILWREVNPLPRALYGLRGISFNNKIFMTG